MKIFIFIFMLATSFQASAYIGPGIGVGTIISILGAIGAVLLAILGIIYYPLKRLIKNKKTK